MRHITLILAIFLFPLTAVAAEKVKGTNYMIVESQGWPTGNSAGYWMMNATGVTQYTLGPMGPGATECHGAGNWGADGNEGEGICVHTEADGTRTSLWKIGKGEAIGHWEIVSGTGKYVGITGQGTYKSMKLPNGRVISEFEGDITLAN